MNNVPLRALFIALLLALVGGVASGEPVQDLDAVSQGADPGTLLQDTLSLAEALEQALAGHRDAERARLTLREARMNRLNSRLRLTPRLTLHATAPVIEDSRSEVWTEVGDSLRLVQVNWSQRRESAGLALVNDLPLGTRVSLGADLYHRRSRTQSFPEEYGGAWSARVSQDLLPRGTLLGDLAESEREADQAELEALELLAAFQHRVATAFLGQLRGQEELQLSRQDLDISNNNLRRAKSRLEAGLIAESDYLKVELEDLQLRASFQSDSLGLAHSGRELMRLLDRGEDSVPPLKETLPDPGEELGIPDRPELERELLAENADLSRQRLETLKARRRLAVARVDLLPDLSLDAAWTWREEADEWLAAPDTPRLDRSLSLQLAWPLWAGGTKSRELQLSRIQARRQDLRGDELSEALLAELDQLLLRRSELLMQLPIRRRQVELATRDAGISQERYLAGQITSQILIDAERSLSQARLQLLHLQVAWVQADRDLRRLTGRDRDALRALLED